MQADTVRIIERYVPAERYIEGLERLDDQLGVMWTFAGAVVGVLGVLFGVGAIVAGVLLFRQEKAHKRAIDEFLAEYRAILDRMLAETNARIELVIEEEKNRMDGTIEALRAQITGENREKMEQLIGEVEEQKQILVRRLAALSVPSPAASFGGLLGLGGIPQAAPEKAAPVNYLASLATPSSTTPLDPAVLEQLKAAVLKASEKSR